MIMGLPRGGFVDANLMLMYPLYTGGRLSAMVRQAAALRNASEAELAAQQEDVALMTRTAYREVLARRALVQVWKARLKEDQERLRIDRARFAQERIPSFYVQRDEAEAAATQQELTNAERDAALSLVQLRTVMGVHPASRIEVVGPLEYQPSSKVIAQMTAGAVGGSSQESGAATELPADLAALLSLAERERPELRSARERVQSAQAESAVARSAFRPQVNLFGMSDLMKMKGEDSSAGVTYGVVASFPLYNGGQQRARLQTAEAERRRQEQEEERVALQVAQEVTSALLNLRAAEQNIQTAQAALTAAQEESRVARLRYEVGRSVVVEALDALAARVRAEANVVQALFQYNVAGDQLKRAVGGSSMASSFGLTSSGSDG
jgi:outer membrane protein TolC